MKNKKLINKLNIIKSNKSVLPIQGNILTSLKGGKIPPNCNQNICRRLNDHDIQQ